MHWLLRLYPRMWRERYEEEMLAVLEDHKVTLATVFDLLVGALDANLNYDGVTEGAMMMLNRLRSGTVMIFCAFIVFGLGWSALARLTDPVPTFQSIAKLHPEFSVLFNSVFIVGCLAFVAFLVGGLPVFFISVKRAVKNQQRDVLFPLWVALSCLVLFALETAVLADWHHIVFARTHMSAFVTSYLILFALLLLVGTTAVSLMIARTNFQVSELKFTFVPEIVILFGMVVAVVLSTILIITITAHAPQLFNSQDVNSSMFVFGIIFMALGTIFASLGLKRTMVKA